MDDFKKEVKLALIKADMTQRQLCRRVAEELGIEADETYISAVISGLRKSEPVTNAIKQILQIGE